MERPSTDEISNTFKRLEELYYDLEQYCNSLQEHNNSLVNQVFRLSRSKRLLDALEAAGVDNWKGYEHAQEIFREGEN